ncbi:MAG: (2Fe-2S)-binding protein [Planctomycetia bacterium]|nr:(2Fe-2S)-binding protein [Planctomycetia bacterium]
MELDDPVCLCFRVTKRKLLAYLRTQQPQVASRLSECGGAGTGCGWCVPFLKKLFEQRELTDTAADYARRRETYRETGERSE